METRYDSKALEQMQKVRLRQARRHRKTLRAVQGKAAAILERPQESRRRSRWRVASGNCRREDEEEITTSFSTSTSYSYLHRWE